MSGRPGDLYVAGHKPPIITVAFADRKLPDEIPKSFGVPLQVGHLIVAKSGITYVIAGVVHAESVNGQPMCQIVLRTLPPPQRVEPPAETPSQPEESKIVEATA